MQVQIVRSKTGQPMQYRNVFHAGYSIAKSHGVRGVYQALPATLLRNIPANASFFGTLLVLISYINMQPSLIHCQKSACAIGKNRSRDFALRVDDVTIMLLVFQ